MPTCKHCDHECHCSNGGSCCGELGGKEIKISKGTLSGTAQGMGAAKKGGKYHWVGPNDSKW